MRASIVTFNKNNPLYEWRGSEGRQGAQVLQNILRQVETFLHTERLGELVPQSGEGYMRNELHAKSKFCKMG